MEKPFRPHGVFPALVTPFTKEGELDEAALRELVRFCIPHVDGFVPCGTTGEFIYMSPQERQRVLEVVLDEVEGEKPVIAGTGAAGTREAIKLASAAKEAGASACLVVTPYYLHPSDKGIYQHFYEIARNVNIPIIMYNIPQAAGEYIPRTVIEDLADIDNIVGLKDSSGDLAYIMEVLEMTEGRLDVLVGYDEVVLPALAGGCSGMILASAQVFPDVWQRVYRAVKEGDLKTARKLQMRVQKLSRIFCRHGGAVAIKAALNMMGVNVGRPRRPLKPVGGALIHETRAEIRMELEKVGKIPMANDQIPSSKSPLAERFEDVGLTADVIREAGLRMGSGAAGEGTERVQLDLVAGPKDGPLGEAYAYQLTYPLHRREALTTILEPNLTVRPSTLIVPALEQRNLRQANMIYGPTQSAVAKAIVDNLEQGVIPVSAVESEAIMVKATVHPRALDRYDLHRSAYLAMDEAIKEAFGGR